MKNIVICSDGTGNSFKRHKSNVASMVSLVATDHHKRQVVVYDQGIGTDAGRWKEIEDFRRTIADPKALHVLPGPHESWNKLKEYSELLWGLAVGYGLEANVRQMYQLLAELYEPGDRVFLFGFSRGAFTVRALAGLIYRCALPRLETAADDRLFDRAWQLYVPLAEDHRATAAFKDLEGQRKCAIHFLGLWDTVKSYGGLRPVMLPHLRHNPIVSKIRHALALDEKRGWFDATTWGRLDLDQEPHRAMSRLTTEERALIMKQDIAEVWFRGAHSDVGCGRIALRWMLAEAAHEHLFLSEEGERSLAMRDPEPEFHESHTLPWKLIEIIPRNEINNFGEWPTTVPATSSGAVRHPEKLLREQMISMHKSVGRAGPNIRVVETHDSTTIRGLDPRSTQRVPHG